MNKSHDYSSRQFEKKRLSQLERIANHIEKIRLGEYIEMMNHPGRLIWTNLLIGISRGVGLTVGATLVIAVLFKILSALIAMNIPYLTDLLQDVVQIIKEVPGGNTLPVPNEAATHMEANDIFHALPMEEKK